MCDLKPTSGHHFDGMECDGEDEDERRGCLTEGNTKGTPKPVTKKCW